MAQIELRVRLDDPESLAGVQEIAQQNHIELRGGREHAPLEVEFLDPVSAVLIAAGVAVVAKFLVGLVDRWRGGVVIDMRNDSKDDVYRDRDLPWGMILIKLADGSVKIETKDEPKDAIERLLEKVIEGAFKTVTDLAEAAKKAVQPGKVEVTPAV